MAIATITETDRIAGLALTGAEALFAELRSRIGDAATGPIYALLRVTTFSTFVSENSAMAEWFFHEHRAIE
jgi:hypothetical protein